MQKLLSSCGLFALCLFGGGRADAQPVYFNTSSSAVSLNTLASVATNSGSQATLFTATGANNLLRCTAVAVDGLNGKLFLLDGVGASLWSVNLNGTGLSLVRSNLTLFPTDLALDVLHEKIYYTTSSTLQNNNTVQRMDYTGANNSTIFTATGASPGNGVSRCTALAVDSQNSKLFLADAGARTIWSMSLAGAGVAAAAIAASFPTDVAVDPTHQQVYFTCGSVSQIFNVIERVGYGGGTPTTVFTASGSVQRCTALDLDVAHSTIYLSDAAANTLWKVPLGGGSATALLSGLTATAKKVRWFSGPTNRPSPGFIGFNLSGQNATFSSTNGYVGGTYYVLTSTNVTTPLSEWLPVATNVLGATGPFSISVTNALLPPAAARFFLLRVK